MGRMRLGIFLIMVLLAPRPAMYGDSPKPDSGNEALRQYLQKSNVVLVGEVTDGLQRIGVDFRPDGVVHIVQFEFKVSEFIQGNIQGDRTIQVIMTSPIDPAIPKYLPAEKERLILFLNQAGDCWESADKGIGKILFNPTLVDQLKRFQCRFEEKETRGIGNRVRNFGSFRLCR